MYAATKVVADEMQIDEVLQVKPYNGTKRMFWNGHAIGTYSLENMEEYGNRIHVLGYYQ